MTAVISDLEFARYRSFRDHTTVRLRRLTLVYGENNAGKSALVRLPQIIAASRMNGQPGLDLRAAVMRRAGFRDIQWRGPLASGEERDLRFGVKLSGDVQWSWTLRWLESRSVAVVERLEVTDSTGQTNLELVGSGRDSPYRVSGGATMAVGFDGVMPRSGTDPRIDRHRDALSQALDGVSWLAALREGPSREGAARGVSGKLEGDGGAASSLVLADPPLRHAVSAWFKTHCGSSIEPEALGSEMERLVLRPESGHDIPFPDAGEGIQQVFPLVVAAECLRRDGGFLIVEEPESHLHPRLQRALADLFIEVLASQSDATVLLETHSEVFLVAALLASTQRIPGAVGLQWVESGRGGASVIEEIEIDHAGRPLSPRLEQAFDTMGILRRELISARRAQENSRAG